MTVAALSALYRYFQALYNLNQHLIILCGVDVLDNEGQYQEHVEEVALLIPRLVPYVLNKKTEKYQIRKGDGLLEFSGEIPLLEESYCAILKKHKKVLSSIKAIRNKLEHSMHAARVVASGSGTSCLFEITYKIKDVEFEITANELISLIKELNILFSHIQDLVDSFSDFQGQSFQDYRRRLVRYPFKDFNKIYDSPLLRTFGKALLPF